jgi:hypothetical protein
MLVSYILHLSWTFDIETATCVTKKNLYETPNAHMFMLQFFTIVYVAMFLQ